MFILHLNISILLDYKRTVLIFLLFFIAISSKAQCTFSASTAYCENNPGVKYLITDENQLQKEFYFDNFSKYTRGITMGGSTILKLAVRTSSAAPLGMQCHWKLVMTIDNFDFASGASPEYWDNILTYGTGTDKPEISLFEVRVTNACQTPLNNGQWQHFINSGESLTIIDPGIDLNPNNAITCTSFGNQVNGPGTYLGPDYNEYTFTIDYRLVPGYNYTPGAYRVKVNFCLTEN